MLAQDIDIMYMNAKKLEVSAGVFSREKQWQIDNYENRTEHLCVEAMNKQIVLLSWLLTYYPFKVS